MPTEKIDNVSVSTQANVYFDGKCVSHGITFADGTKKSVGVILPASLTFNTGAPRSWNAWPAPASTSWPAATSGSSPAAGEKFSVPGNSSFEIRVAAGEAYHYICHFG
jgi:uncharacterized protein YaiE (UPF0345 family)